MAEQGQGPFKFSLGPSGGAGGPPQYCNGVQMFISSWDFNFEFYQVVPILSEQEGEPSALTRNVVQRTVMSPQHAKAFLEILSQNVAAWEAQFGEIQLSPPNSNPPP